MNDLAEAIAIRLLDGQIEQGRALLKESHVSVTEANAYQKANRKVLERVFGFFSDEFLSYHDIYLHSFNTEPECRSAVRVGIIYMESVRNFFPKMVGQPQGHPANTDNSSSRQNLISKESSVLKSNLYTTLLAMFNLEEIKSLCFILTIDYEGLAGENKEGKVRELILYCVRHDRILELRRKCMQLRSNVIW